MQPSQGSEPKEVAAACFAVECTAPSKDPMRQWQAEAIGAVLDRVGKTRPRRGVSRAGNTRFAP